jgi:hypothetical protein
LALVSSMISSGTDMSICRLVPTAKKILILKLMKVAAVKAMQRRNENQQDEVSRGGMRDGQIDKTVIAIGFSNVGPEE